GRARRRRPRLHRRRHAFAKRSARLAFPGAAALAGRPSHWAADHDLPAISGETRLRPANYAARDRRRRRLPRDWSGVRSAAAGIPAIHARGLAMDALRSPWWNVAERAEVSGARGARGRPGVDLLWEAGVRYGGTHAIDRRPADVRDRVAERIRDDGAAARSRRPLWRRRLRGDPANARARHPHRDWRDAGRRGAAAVAAGGAVRGERHGGGHPGGARRGACVARNAL